jgi:transposase
MMGRLKSDQGQLFYEFHLNEAVPKRSSGPEDLGYVFAIRSERLICREVQVNLAYRWFCKLGIEDDTPDHSAFSRARNERFRDGMFLLCVRADRRTVHRGQSGWR